MVRAKRISDNTASAIVPIFIILSFLRFYIRNTTIQDAITIITFSAGFFLPFFCSNNLIGRRSISIIVVSFFSLCGIFVSISGINETRQSIFLFLSHLGIVLFISEYKISSPRDLYLLNLSLLIFFLFHALIGADPNDIFTVSRNYISVLLLLSLSFYIYSCQNNNKHP